MESKQKLTDQLKDVENQYLQEQYDMRAIQSKLKTAYQYEDELNNRLINAKSDTEKLRKEAFEKSSKITSLLHDMKNIVDVFTGNFLKS